MKYVILIANTEAVGGLSEAEGQAWYAEIGAWYEKGGGGSGQRERPLAGGAGLLVAPEPGKQAGPQRVEEPVSVELGGERRDLGERGLGPEHVPGGDGPVEQHDGGRRERLQPVVEQADLAPV